MSHSISGLLNLSLLLLCLTLACKSTQNSLAFDFQSMMIPHPEKAHRGGEDAYFNHTKMLVISDGVGGWNNRGIDPSKYSRFLCEKSQQLLNQNQSKYLNDPLAVITEAAMVNDNVGSATMEVLTLPNQNKLKYCYIGGNIDSGFMVIRKYQENKKNLDEILYVSIFQYVEQQHAFNFPFQLALSQYGGDDPALSVCGELTLQENDIIVVGSDGLYDNVSFREVLKKVEEADKNGNLLSTLARQLAELAISRGKDGSFNSPFAQRAKQQNLYYTGGKLDDTTVIVARVVGEKLQEL